MSEETYWIGFGSKMIEMKDVEHVYSIPNRSTSADKVRGTVSIRDISGTECSLVIEENISSVYVLAHKYVPLTDDPQLHVAGRYFVMDEDEAYLPCVVLVSDFGGCAVVVPHEDGLSIKTVNKLALYTQIDTWVHYKLKDAK